MHLLPWLIIVHLKITEADDAWSSVILLKGVDSWVSEMAN